MTGPTVIRVLIVEDFADDAELVAQQLRKGGMALTYERVETAGQMADALSGYAAGRGEGDLPPLDLPLVAKPFDASTLLRKVRTVLTAS